MATGGLCSADPYARAAAYLGAMGVDVEHELARVARELEYKSHRVRAEADGIRDLAMDLNAAERALLAESRGYLQGAVGFTSARLAEARERVSRLTAALDEACVHDADLVRHVRRQVV